MYDVLQAYLQMIKNSYQYQLQGKHILKLIENFLLFQDMNFEHIQKLIISEGIVEIRDGAFKGCDKLREVVIPHSANTIGKDAFPHGQNIVIYCYGGSYGLDFARQYKYKYRNAEDIYL